MAEGRVHPKMSVGQHGRISGHPARAMALARFLDYVQGHNRVWVCRREDIARHWGSVWVVGQGLLPETAWFVSGRPSAFMRLERLINFFRDRLRF